MKCLNCSRELKNLVDHFGHLHYDCLCGISYTPELIDNADKKEWEHVRIWRLFTVVKNHGKPSHILVHTIFSSGKSRIVHPLHYKIHQFLIKKGWIKEWV